MVNTRFTRCPFNPLGITQQFYFPCRQLSDPVPEQTAHSIQNISYMDSVMQRIVFKVLPHIA